MLYPRKFLPFGSSLIRALIIAALAICGVIGCASTTPSKPKPMPSMPGAWAQDINLTHTNCAPISGQFSNLGEHYVLARGESREGHLAEDVLARQLPQSQPARVVVLQSDADRNILVGQISGRMTRKIAIEISCDSGWHTFSFERSGTYLGGGIQEEQFRQVAWFREDGEGRLVARVVMDAQLKTDSGSGSEASAENWYRFERAASAP